MPRISKVLITLLGLLLPQVATGEMLEIICIGTSHIYENGFGSKDNSDIKGNKLVYIDTEKETLKTETFIGVQSAKLKKSNESYWAEFVIKKEHNNGFIHKETVNIDRYTGDATFLFYVNVAEKDVMYIHFDGKCQKARKLF